METDSISYLTQITKLQSYSAVSVLQNTPAEFQQWQTVLCEREKV